MPEEELFDPPPPRMRGYAPHLCSPGPAHHARRDTAVTTAIVWKCVECGARWTTAGTTYEEDQ